MYLKRFLVLLILLLWGSNLSFAQTDSLSLPQSLYLGAGLGWHNTDNYFEGGGTFFTLGYEQFKNERLRLSYSASFMWSNFNPGSGPNDLHEFNSYSIRVLANYDLVKKSRLSVFGGLGPVWTRAKGVKARLQLGSLPPADDIAIDTSYGIAMNLGLRIEPKPGNIGFELVPFNAHLNVGQTEEFFFQLRFFKLFR